MDLKKYRNRFPKEYAGGRYTRQELQFRVKKAPKNPEYSNAYPEELEKKIKRLIEDPEMPGIAYERDGRTFGVTIESIKSESHQDMAGRAHDTIFDPFMLEPVNEQPKGRRRLEH